MIERSVSDGARPASETRVAQAGKGNSRQSGTGMSGWLTNMVPGLASRARCRWAGGRKPYSGRDASAGSSRPTTRIAELVTIRRSTSLAVCCAPTRITPSERPRSAMSSSTSLIGEEPSRGAYLLSSSRTTKSSGLAVPAFSLRSNSLLQRHADHEALRPVRQVVQVDHGDLGALGGVDRVRAAGGQVAPDQPAQVLLAADQPAGERVDGAQADRAARPVAPGSRRR